ncbi:hypothetical protein DFS34DRAFT_627662 [Phlyctochytrium arcticum]|nr:hypothetical protein DFS34DRAFT_627662 [Phlyctochytrium arcticum]
MESETQDHLLSSLDVPAHFINPLPPTPFQSNASSLLPPEDDDSAIEDFSHFFSDDAIGSDEEIESAPEELLERNDQQAEGDDVDQIPEDVGLQMDQATQDVGISVEDHSQLLWEEDEDAMREIQETVGDFDDDWGGNNTNQKKKKRRGKGKRKVRTELTDAQSDIVGKANVAYTLGDYAEAVKLLHEVIKEAPNAYQAWVTLAMVHDELGDTLTAMRTYMMAAHLSPKDGDLWRRLGVMSKKFGHNEQALYCLTNAIRVDPSDIDALWDRSVIYLDRRMMQKAIDDLKAILRIVPHNMPVVKQLCKIYVGLNDITKATVLFENALEEDSKNPLQTSAYQPEEGESDVDDDEETEENLDSNTAPPTRMGYEELNMLAELYIEATEFEKALIAIKQGARRIQGRTSETYWDSYDDDREYTSETANEGTELPLELHVKMGICRLWLGQADMAKEHFVALYATPIAESSELYFDVADAYVGKRMFTSALSIYETLRLTPETDIPTTWSKMAFCYHQMGNLEIAAHMYSDVIEAAPQDVDSKIALAQVYEELGEEDRAAELTAQVDAHSRELLEQELVEESTAGEAGGGNSMAFIRDAVKEKRKPKDRALAEAAALQRSKETRVAYAKIVQLFPKVNDRVTRADLLRTARVLVMRFQGTRAFYPSDRGKVFTSLNNRLKIRTGQEGEGFSTESSSHLDTPAPKSDDFQGLTFHEWYEVFIKYAYSAVIDGKEQDAQAALKSAFEANVFFHDEQKKIALRLHMICVAIYAGNAARVTEMCRWFCQYKTFTNDAYRLYSAMQTGSSEAVSCYAMSSSVKYFVRQLKHMSKMHLEHPDRSEYQNMVLLTTYGHILQAGRSYLAAIGVYTQAFQYVPDDPMINLSLGIAHLHRAMQRKSDNRHQHVIYGFTFVMRYYELVGGDEGVERGKGDAAFNVARAFHQIGLTYLAIPYYEKVLKISERLAPTSDVNESNPISGTTALPSQTPFEDLKSEAAYNLSMIYIANGSTELAERLLRKYCTV